ncbi:MAG: pyrroline-5-carboxylate reductase [Pseudomonadota bacterium]
MVAQKITVVGAGRMGTALITGWLTRRSRPHITIVDPEPSALILATVEEEKLKLNPEPSPADVLVLCVKPQIFRSVSKSLTGWIGPKTLVVSIMAGIRLKQLTAHLETERVVRAMPNTPGAIGRGVTAICTPDDLAKKDLTTTERLLKPLGYVEGPLPETQISAITALSGSGPAYLFLLVDALAGAGEAEGLDPKLAERLARETVIGAAALLEESGASPDDLRKAVTSKGGTTEAALDILMRGDGMPSLLREAVRAAATRERALSSET